MATNPDRWYFTREQLRNNPTIKCGVDPEKELSYRQQAANLIQDMGQRLQVYQLCINTAIVYMHRFYMIHSFTKFPRNSIAAAALFLAAKVEEQPHKLEHVIRVAHACLHRGEPPLDARSNAYLQQSQELVINESIVLQTLGFEVGVVHPHTHVVKCTQMIRASKDLSQSSYFLATNSLHLTTFSLQYKPTVVACVCIHLACKWTQWDIPKSNDGKQWWEYVDPTVTEELLDDLTREFLIIIDKCPTRLKKRIMAVKGNTSSKGRQQRNDATSNSDSTNQQSSRPGPSSSLGSVDSGLTDGASHDAFDYSFDSKASGFDQFSDFDQDQPAKTDVSFQQKVEKSAAKDTSSNPSPAPSVPRQGLPEAPRKPEPVRVSYEEYKRKERERKERELQMKKEQQIPSSNAGDKTDNVNFAHVRPVQKESKHQGYDKVPAGNPALTKEKIQATHMKIPSSHDRKPHGPDRKPSGHERKLAGPDRNLSGHERVTSSHDRISSGHEKVSSGHARPPGHERIPSAQGVKPDKSQSSVDIPKRPPHDERRDKRESKPPELQSVSHPGVIGIETNPGSGTSVRISAGSVVDVHVKKERAERRHEQSVESRGKSSKPQSSEHRKHRSQHHNPHHKGGDGSAGERTIKPAAAPQPSTQDIPMFKQEPVETELAKQETLDMLSQLRDEVIKDLEKESTSAKNTSETYKPLSGPDSLKSEPVGGKVVPRVQPPPVMPEIALPVGVNDSKPVEKSFIKLAKEDKSTDKRVEQVDSPKVESRKEHSSRKRDHSEKREDHEKRREGHRSRKEERRHKSHKHRHSPSVKSTGENDLAGGSGEMAPAKKLKLENADSRDSAPHTVLTTSQGIRLKIKGLSNSFNNGNDHSNGKQESEKAGNSNSPSSISLKLNLTRLNSSHTVSSPGESSQEQEHSNHRSHHKHKSRSHHRSKEGHHKRSRSPATSSASERDGSPAVSSPAKRKTPESVQATKSGIPNNQSLLRLPMPPGDPAKSSSHRHSSPGGKHSKHKRGTPPVRPPLPDEDVPPPPPPLPHYPQHAPLSTVTALPPMQYSTIDPSALYGSYQPPLPKEKHVNKRPPPPPPPLPPPETRPPLPP